MVERFDQMKRHFARHQRLKPVLSTAIQLGQMSQTSLRSLVPILKNHGGQALHLDELEPWV